MSTRRLMRRLTVPVSGWRGRLRGGHRLGASAERTERDVNNRADGRYERRGGVGTALAVLLLTAPVALARRQPVATAAVLAAGAVLNWALFDHMVRCGVGLPAMFCVALVVGWRTIGWRPAALGMALLVVNLVFQAYSNPLARVAVRDRPTVCDDIRAVDHLGVHNDLPVRLRIRPTAVKLSVNEAADAVSLGIRGAPSPMDRTGRQEPTIQSDPRDPTKEHPYVHALVRSGGNADPCI